MKAGDHFGWVWLKYGVISFDYVRSKGHYCENKVNPRVGNRLRLQKNRYSNRDYSIRVNFRPACSELSITCRF